MEDAEQGTKRRVSVDGIELDMDVSALDDFELTEAIADMSDETLDDDSRTRASVAFVRIVLGGEYPRVKRELRAAHGGRLANGDVIDFVIRAVKEAGAKN